LKSFGKGNASVVAICEEMVVLVKVWLHQVHDHTSRLRKSGVFLISYVHGLGASVQEGVENVPVGAVSKGKRLYAPLDRLFGHVLLADEMSTEAKHRLINSKVATWSVAILELPDQPVK